MGECWTCGGDGIIDEEDLERCHRWGRGAGLVMGPCPICELGRRTFGPTCHAHAIASGKTDAVLMDDPRERAEEVE